MASKDFKVKNGLSVGESIRVDSGSIVVAGLEVINSSGAVVGVYQGFDSDFSISILNTTTDSLSEGLGNLYFTTVRADSAFDVRLSTKTTDDLTEGLSLYYTQSRFDSDLSTKTTDDLVEGLNLYYTTSRVDSAFDVRLTIKTTDDLVEGSNLYYTDSRVLSYLTTNSYATTSNIDSAIAALVASAPSQLDTLNELAAAINDDSNFAGTITALIGEKVAKNDFSDYFDSNFSLKTTSNLIEGSNLYYTTARADSAFDVRLSTKTTDDLLEGSDLYFTTARADSAFDVRLSTKTTDDLLEGSNLYYTISRVDSDILDLVDSSYIETRRPAEVIFNVVNNGSSAYSFTGDGFPSSSDNPVLYLQKGLTYKFKVNSPSHPFEIRTSNGGSAYSDGVINNSIGSGDLYFTVPMNAPSTLYYQCTIHSSMVGTIYITEAASITSDEITEGSNNLYYTSSRVDSDILSLVDSAYIQARQVDIYRDSSFVTGIIDSAYINARQIIGGGSGTVDSAQTIALITDLIDSAYIQSRQIIGGVGGGVDSAAVIDLIDSAYIQSRQIIGGVGGGVDSAAVINLIDSDYIQARQIIGGVGGNRISQIYFYYSDSNQSVFSDSDARGRILSYVPGNMSAFINGIMIVDSADYVATDGLSLVLNSGVPLDTELTIVAYPTSFDSAETADIIRSQIVPFNLTNSKSTSIYYYTADSNQTTFTGADDNGSSLSYVAGGLQAYLNGILLVNNTDYTATDGTSVVLDPGANSGDNLTFISNKDLAGIVYYVSDTSYFDYKFIADSGQISFSGNDDNGNLLTFDSNKFSIFINGIRIQPDIDYTANSATNVVDLTYPSDSADEILISTLISGGDNGSYTVIDSDYVQARQTDPVSKAIAISMVFGN